MSFQGSGLQGFSVAFWLPPAACGRLRPPLAASGRLWLPLAASGCLWQPLDSARLPTLSSQEVIGLCLQPTMGKGPSHGWS